MSAVSEQFPPYFALFPPPPIRPHFVQFQAEIAEGPLILTIFAESAEEKQFHVRPTRQRIVYITA